MSIAELEQALKEAWILGHLSGCDSDEIEGMAKAYAARNVPKNDTA